MNLTLDLIPKLLQMEVMKRKRHFLKLFTYHQLRKKGRSYLILSFSLFSVQTNISTHTETIFDDTAKSHFNLKELKGNWTQEEDNLLLHLKNVQKIPTWVEISSYLIGKNPKQCAYRYKKIFLNTKTTNWSKDEDQKLMNFIDMYGENFDFLKQFFPDKSVKELKCRYYSKICYKIYSFTPEEDNLIMNLYRNLPISTEELNALKNKGSSQVRKRLELLLKLKGENLNKNNLNSLFPLLEGSFKKEDDTITNIISSFNDDFSEIICKKSSVFNDATEMDVDMNMSESYSPVKVRADKRLKPLSNIEANKGEYTSIKYDDCYCQENTGFREVNQRLFSDNSLNFKMNIDDSPLFVNKEQNFEKSFIGAFNWANDKNFTDEFFTVENAPIDAELKERYKENKHFHELLSKKEDLETILKKIYTISDMFCQDFDNKIWLSNLSNDKKLEMFGLYNSIVSEEKMLFVKLESTICHNSMSEEVLLMNLTQKVNYLEELIKVEKMKIKLVDSVYCY